MAMNSGGGGRPGRGPIRTQETRKDHRKTDYEDHRLDGCDPDEVPYP